MSDRSPIEWRDATWNPVRGCTKVSPGCKFCYAELFAERFRGAPGHLLPQMPLGERAARAGFQIAFEGQRSRFVTKCDDNVEFPRAIPRRVDAFASVMRTESRPQAGCDACIVATLMSEAPDHVDESFR